MKQNEEIARQLLYTLNAYNWAVNRYSNEKMEEIDIGHIIKVLSAKDQEYEAKIEDLEKELLGLRSYCTLTFGESHPEIKKCVHEVELEQLKNKEKRDG